MPTHIVTNNSHRDSLQDFAASTFLVIALKTTGRQVHNPRQAQLSTIQIGNGETMAVIDAEQVDCREFLQPLLENPSIIKVFHRAKFAIKHFLHHWETATQGVFCTYHASQILAMGAPGRRHRLVDLSRAQLGRDSDCPWETLWQRKGPFSQQDVPNAVEELELLTALYKAMQARILEHKLKRISRLEFRTILPVAAMELKGIYIDIPDLNNLRKKFQQRRAEQEQAAIDQIPNLEKNLLGQAELNLSSPKQVLKALQEAGIPLKDTSENQLRMHLDQNPWLQGLLDYRHLSIILQMFEQLENAVDPQSGRVHATYHQIASPSGRFACSDPNIQQVPREKEVRALIRPEAGYTYIVADYSQVELRVAAGLAEDPVMMEAYRNGQDLHRLTAALTMGKAVEAVTADERQAAKAINFGLIYAMGAGGLQASAKNSYGVSLSENEAATFRRRFFENYHGIARWQRGLEAFAKKYQHVRTAGGRIRAYGEGPMRITEVFNTPVQGTAAEGLKSALCLFWDKTRAQAVDAAIVAIIHDEIIVEAHADQVDLAKTLLNEAMIEGISWLVPNVPFVADAAVTESWAGK
ncbi:DNA polymerase [Acanthopleuribacter pedis]|uniref:DNA polymerase I n=1 Tax=Acanthopleuribacter pedis TaxID=442870 RepID=A0A8J7QAQ2_9BACT|nr:DNA polymerase [Acanthopleuribacter pedis]MBO1320967.1 hypothetical protein [Acanthopleuribacter pedis]